MRYLMPQRVTPPNKKSPIYLCVISMGDVSGKGSQVHPAAISACSLWLNLFPDSFLWCAGIKNSLLCILFSQFGITWCLIILLLNLPMYVEFLPLCVTMWWEENLGYSSPGVMCEKGWTPRWSFLKTDYISFRNSNLTEEPQNMVERSQVHQFS